MLAAIRGLARHAPAISLYVAGIVDVVEVVPDDAALAAQVAAEETSRAVSEG